jgi:hypothetical protein
VKYEPARIFVIGVKRTPGFVKLLLRPRQSRGISLRIRSGASGRKPRKEGIYEVVATRLWRRRWRYGLEPQNLPVSFSTANKK